MGVQVALELHMDVGSAVINEKTATREHLGVVLSIGRVLDAIASEETALGGTDKVIH